MGPDCICLSGPQPSHVSTEATDGFTKLGPSQDAQARQDESFGAACGTDGGITA